MCMTTLPSEFHNMLVSITKAEIVYSKEHDGGTLYVLIHTHPKKKHSTLDKNISAMDMILKTATNTSTTFFKSISPHYEGKVKTFENTEHIDDPLFHVIFNVQESGAAIGRKFNLQPGVHRYVEHKDSQDIINQEQLNLILQKDAEGKNNGEICIAKNKRPRVEEAGEGAGGSAMVMDALAQPVSVEFLNSKTRFANNNKGKHPAPTSLLKGNYSAIRSTPQAANDEPTTAGAEKDAAIAALTASNAKKDAVIERLTNAIEQLATSNAEKDGMIRALQSLTNAFESRMDRLQTTTDDAKLQRAQHTNDLETKIDQVRTAVISRAEGTGRQITTALDSHEETMVAEMDRMMQEKGACEQHVMEKYQRASAKANRYAQTKKGVFTKKFNKAKKAYVAEIQKLKTDLVVETKIRQCVINNFFELIPIPSDRQTAKQHRPKESPPAPPTPP